MNSYSTTDFFSKLNQVAFKLHWMGKKKNTHIQSDWKLKQVVTVPVSVEYIVSFSNNTGNRKWKASACSLFRSVEGKFDTLVGG